MAEAIEFDINLAEFTYTVARQATIAMKRRLPERLFQKIATEKGSMRFAMRSTLEEKREFFTYLGLENYLIFVHPDALGNRDFRSIFTGIDKKDSAGEVLQKMGGENVFVTSSKQLAYRLGFVAQSMDSDVYTMNQQLIRTTYHPKNFANKIHVPEYAESKEGNKSATEVIKIISSVIWAHDTSKAALGIDGDALRILLFYYENRNRYLVDKTIYDKFVGSLSKSKITLCRKRLAGAEYITRSTIISKSEYTISGKGILVVNEFRERVIKSIAF